MLSGTEGRGISWSSEVVYFHSAYAYYSRRGFFLFKKSFSLVTSKMLSTNQYKWHIHMIKIEHFETDHKLRQRMFRIIII